MTYRLVIFTALVAIARAGYINGGHSVGPSIGGSYASNVGLLRPGSPSYSSGYGYPVGPGGRSYTSGVSGSVVVRPGYGTPYQGYGGRNLPVGVSNYQSISGYGGRSLSYPSSTYSYTSSPILKNGGYQSGYSSGFNGGYNNGYPSSNLQNGYQSSNLQNGYGHQPIAYTVSPIAHNPHGSFNGLGTGYGY